MPAGQDRGGVPAYSTRSERLPLTGRKSTAPRGRRLYDPHMQYALSNPAGLQHCFSLKRVLIDT